MHDLNYHHLRYFWAVAREGSLTKAARILHVSPSALSTQIRQLEDALGQTLFVRSARSMQPTEAGRVALDYAQSIFASGDELLRTLRDSASVRVAALRIGSVATLSRNFQDNFIRPVLTRDDVRIHVQSGSLRDLLARLRVHTLDVVLANQRVQGTPDDPWRCQLLARQPVSLIGHPRGRRSKFRFPKDVEGLPLLLPGGDNEIRAAFDLICSRVGVRYRLRGEVDDMALLRLLARDSDAVALVPSVVVQDELRTGVLQELCQVPDLQESFYAITVPSRFPPALLKELLRRSSEEMLSHRGTKVPT
jgi:LysR family transcriptional regulator, transcriptional activator of nhaA